LLLPDNSPLLSLPLQRSRQVRLRSDLSGPGLRGPLYP